MKRKHLSKGIFGEEFLSALGPMRITVFLTALALVLPAIAFSDKADNLVKQQRAIKQKQAAARAEAEREGKAQKRCVDKVTSIVASKIKELMDKGVKFEKPYVRDRDDVPIEGIIGKEYRLDFLTEDFVRISRYNGKLIVLEKSDGATIFFQPERGKGAVRMSLEFGLHRKDSTVKNGWELQTTALYLIDAFKNRELEKINFESFYDVGEVEKKRDLINDIIVMAIEASLK